MRKYILLALLFSVAALPAFAQMPVVTVLDFQMNSVSENDMKSITSFLSASLHDTGKYTVIDTAQRDTILEELAFSNSGCTDESCQLEIGMLLSAEFIVTGDIALVGGRYILSARMLETETSATTNTSKGIYTDLSGLIDDMPLFALELAGDTVNRAEVLATRTAPAADSSVSREIAAWSTLGLGAVAAGVGGYFLYSAFNYKTTAVDPAYDAYIGADISTSETSVVDSYNALWSDYDTKYTEFSSKLLYSSILTGAGLASMITSAVLFLMDEPTEDNNIALMIMPAPNAATLSCQIRM